MIMDIYKKYVGLLAWRSKFEKMKSTYKKINGMLMPVVWHSKSDGIFACQKKKEIEPIFNAFSVCQ